jgi:hypothetical protein
LITSLSAPLISTHTLRAHALTAYLRRGKAAAFLAARAVVAPACALVSRCRMARVFLTRRSRGTYFLPAYAAFRAVRVEAVMTVRVRAMPLRTSLL